MIIHVCDITIHNNNSYYISNETTKSLLNKIKNKSKYFKFKGNGKLVGGRKILYFESDLNVVELNKLITIFLKRYEFMSFNLVCKTTSYTSENKMNYNELIKDAYNHDKNYPDYGSINENY